MNSQLIEKKIEQLVSKWKDADLTYKKIKKQENIISLYEMSFYELIKLAKKIKYCVVKGMEKQRLSKSLVEVKIMVVFLEDDMGNIYQNFKCISTLTNSLYPH